jgi:hypothetical protein
MKETETLDQAAPAIAPEKEIPAVKSNSSQSPEYITKAGAILIPNEEKLRDVPLFHYAERGQWYSGDGRGGYSKISDSQAKAFVAAFGFHKNVKDTYGNTIAESAMLWLSQNKRVAYAGPLAGYPAGVHESAGIRFLVTESPTFIRPKDGKCFTIRGLIESMFLDDDYDQKIHLYQWMSESYKAFYRRMTTDEVNKFRHCPALAIFGPRGCGKSALIDLVVGPLFGGKKADPMNYLRDQKFNKDLFQAPLLVLDDKGASTNLAERRERGERIKDLIWKPEQRMEGKGADALNLCPFWRLIIAGNDDDSGLQVCPALSPGLRDKLIILRTRRADGLPTTHEENDAWAKVLRGELPAFADWLLSWSAPENLTLNDRTRVSEFQHPKIVSALCDLQPEMRLLELIDTLLLTDLTNWEGSATEFESMMRDKDTKGLLDRIFTSSTAAGRMLSELSRLDVSRGRIIKTDREGRSYYRVFRADVVQKDNPKGTATATG